MVAQLERASQRLAVEKLEALRARLHAALETIGRRCCWVHRSPTPGLDHRWCDQLHPMLGASLGERAGSDRPMAQARAALLAQGDLHDCARASLQRWGRL